MSKPAGLKGFIRALKERDLKGLRDRLEKLRTPKGDFWRGYRLALEGMYHGLVNGGEQVTVQCLVSGKLAEERIRRLLVDFDEQARRPWVPEDERGFCRAWAEVLEEFMA